MFKHHQQEDTYEDIDMHVHEQQQEQEVKEVEQVEQVKQVTQLEPLKTFQIHKHYPMVCNPHGNAINFNILNDREYGTSFCSLIFKDNILNYDINPPISGFRITGSVNRGELLLKSEIYDYNTTPKDKLLNLQPNQELFIHRAFKVYNECESNIWILCDSKDKDIMESQITLERLYRNHHKNVYAYGCVGIQRCIDIYCNNQTIVRGHYGKRTKQIQTTYAMKPNITLISDIQRKTTFQQQSTSNDTTQICPANISTSTVQRATTIESKARDIASNKSHVTMNYNTKPLKRKKTLRSNAIPTNTMNLFGVKKGLNKETWKKGCHSSFDSIIWQRIDHRSVGCTEPNCNRWFHEICLKNKYHYTQKYIEQLREAQVQWTCPHCIQKQQQ